MTNTVSQQRKGFTLIELLLVIGIIAILAAIVIVAINPTKQLGNARDAQRRSDVNTVLNAVYQYTIDNNGTLPGYLTGATTAANYQICNCNSSYCPLRSACGTTMINLRELTGSYIVAIPRDPRASNTLSGSRYLIRKDASNRITVSAPDVETTGTTISVTR
jgi:prepilin-type N-terminal cleavage/methylation domain-containing protein